MFNMHKSETVNRICITISSFSIIALAIQDYFVRYSYRDCLVYLGFFAVNIIATILYIFCKNNSLIKYVVVWGTIINIYIALYFEHGRFDDVYFLFVAVVITSIYFDSRFTLLTTILTILSSVILFIGWKPLFFPVFSVDFFSSMLECIILIGTILFLQTFWSKKLVQSQFELYDKAVKDNLTSVYNRTFFEEAFKDMVFRCKCNKKDLSIIMIDIDNFKVVNDTYGHRKGDLVLKAVSHRICTICDTKNIIARIGGEEFMVLLEDTNIEKAEVITEKIRKVITETRIEEIEITISLGTTSLREHDSEITVFERVDKALYQAKNNGKNCFVVI